MTDPREVVWNAAHEALPAGWRVGPPTYDPARRQWSVTARSPTPGRRRAAATVSGTGEDELAALSDLDARLRGTPRPADDAAKREALNRRLRLAFYQGAEDESRRAMGRGLTTEELERVAARLPQRGP